MNRRTTTKERSDANDQPENLAIDETSFPLGIILVSYRTQIVASFDEIRQALSRHAAEDWGDVDEIDYAHNLKALAFGKPVHSYFHTKNGADFLIVTNADRSGTFVMLPDEVKEVLRGTQTSSTDD